MHAVSAPGAPVACTVISVQTLLTKPTNQWYYSGIEIKEVSQPSAHNHHVGYC